MQKIEQPKPVRDGFNNKPEHVLWTSFGNLPSLRSRTLMSLPRTALRATRALALSSSTSRALTSMSRASNSATWLGSTKRATETPGQHTTRFGMKTCSCCVARTVAGLFVAGTATVAATGTVVEAMERKACVGPDCVKKSNISDNNVVAASTSMACAGVVALVLMP